MQNTIIKGHDNAVVFTFMFDGEFAALGLNNFTRITIDIGAESYDSTIDVDKLKISSPEDLILSIGDTTTLDSGNYTPTIIGYSATYDDGYVLNSPDKKMITDTRIR